MVNIGFIIYFECGLVFGWVIGDGEYWLVCGDWDIFGMYGCFVE